MCLKFAFDIFGMYPLKKVFFFLSIIQVFILGYGNIGIELAKRLQPFGARVIATKRSWPASIDSDCMGSLLTPLFALTNPS